MTFGGIGRAKGPLKMIWREKSFKHIPEQFCNALTFSEVQKN
jgi:hypothetical protein